MSHLLGFAFLALSVLPIPLFAGPELGPRTRVTVRPGEQVVTGQLTSMEVDSLHLLRDGGAWIAVARSDVASLEYQVGTRDYVRRGAILGAIAGMLGGAILGHQIEVPMFHPPEEHASDDSGNTGWTVFLGMIGGLVGTAVGAGVGGLFETEEWEIQPTVSVANQHDLSIALVILPTLRAP